MDGTLIILMGEPNVNYDFEERKERRDGNLWRRGGTGRGLRAAGDGDERSADVDMINDRVELNVILLEEEIPRKCLGIFSYEMTPISVIKI